MIICASPFTVIARFMRAIQFSLLELKLDHPDKPGDDDVKVMLARQSVRKFP
jgi:hypothetical protein